MSDDLDAYLDEALRDPAFRALYYDGQHREEVVDVLRACREQQGLSIDDVARRMETSVHAVRRIEGEDSDPKLSTLQQYARAVGARFVVSIDAPEVAE